MSDRPAPAAHLDRLAGALSPHVAREVRDLAAAAEATDGVAPLSEQPLLHLLDTEAPVVHLLARSPADLELIGYAQLDIGAPVVVAAEIVVAPHARRRGVGSALLAAAEAVAAEPGPDGPRSLRVWAHGDLPSARGLVAAEGMGVVRELWQLRLELGDDALPDPPRLPSGVTVRAFVPGQDEEAWRVVNARAFAHHPEQGRLTRADLDARENEPWFDPAGFLLAERDGVLLASIWTKVHPAGVHGDRPVGEIYVLGVDPDAQGLGLGGALTALGVEHLRGLGLRSVILYTDADAEIAIRTYSRVGFARSAVDVMFGSDTFRTPTSDTMSA